MQSNTRTEGRKERWKDGRLLQHQERVRVFIEIPVPWADKQGMAARGHREAVSSCSGFSLRSRGRRFSQHFLTVLLRIFLLGRRVTE